MSRFFSRNGQPMRDHEVKISDYHFLDVQHGRKRFEVRINDRGYQCGDLITLCRLSPIGVLTGESMTFEIVYVHSGIGLKEGWVVIGLGREVTLMSAALDGFVPPGQGGAGDE